MTILREFSPETRGTVIVPSIDFRAIDADDVRDSDGPLTVRLDVSVNVAPAYEHFFVNPSFIDVELDMAARQEFPVTYNLVGNVDTGLELRYVRLTNEIVTIAGTRTNIAKIDKVQVSVELWGIEYDTTIPNSRLEVFDHDGLEITELFHLSVEETTATISAWPIEEVEVYVEITGNLAEGFVIEEYDFEPKIIEVIGMPEDIQSLETIFIEFDLDNRYESFVSEIDITRWLPEGIFLRSGESNIITLVVNTEPVERRTFHIPIGNVRSLLFLDEYEILSQMAFIRIDVYGPSTSLAELTDADIVLELDMRNLSIGTHFVPLNVYLPPGFFTHTAPGLHVQIHDPDAQVDDDYDTEEPEPLADDEPDEDGNPSYGYPLEPDYETGDGNEPDNEEIDD
jgi:YbbR domain-containing protein